MEKEVDIIALCKKLTEMTEQEKCAWKQTSEKNRFKLDLKNGSVEISRIVPDPLDFMKLKRMTYSISLFDISQIRYATYESDDIHDDLYNCFRDLYITIIDVLEKGRRRKIAVLFNELTDSSTDDSEFKK